MKEKQLHLQPRLACIAECVPLGARLADVGTDHGYLPVWLLQNGRIEHVIASDINREPLEHARRTAAEYGTEDRMEFRLCAGLDKIEPGEADTVVIAGMGGETILKILADAPWTRDCGVRLLLQPMTKAEVLRAWLWQNEFCISSERLVRDKGTIYALIAAAAGETAAFTSAEAWCGKKTLDPLYGEYASDCIRKLERAARGMRQSGAADLSAIAALESDADALRKMVKEWENAKGM